MPSHVVKQGECLSKIAAQYGFGVDTIWNHDDNAELREKRKSPNVLYVGDVIAIPEVGQKQVKVTSNATHQFQVKVKPPELRLCLLAGGKPVKDAPYTATVDGEEFEPKKAKKTDGKGMAIVKLATSSEAAEVKVPKQGTLYSVKLGHLDPLTETSGVMARLKQLGYYPGPTEAEPGPLFHIGVWLFQNNHGLVPSGTIDDATLDELKKAYGT